MSIEEILGHPIRTVIDVIDLLIRILVVLGTVFGAIPYLIRRYQRIYSWRRINKQLNKIVKELKHDQFQPTIIVGNSILCNIIDEHFKGTLTVQVTEISEVQYVQQKEFIDKHFEVIQTAMWYHLLSKHTLSLLNQTGQATKCLILVNYINTGNYYEKLYNKLQSHLSLNKDSIKTATIFTVESSIRENTDPDLGGASIPIDYKGIVIKNWRHLYLPWGHVSKMERGSELRFFKFHYLAAWPKLFYVLRATRRDKEKNRENSILKKILPIRNRT